MVFTSCTTSASFTLGWVFIALTPNPQHPITACHSRWCRGTMKWHNNPGQPVTSIQARRVATLSSESEHPAKELKSQNTWVTASDLHVTVCVLITCDWRGAYRGSNTGEKRQDLEKHGETERKRGGQRDLFIECQWFYSTCISTAWNMLFFSVKCGVTMREKFYYTIHINLHGKQ